MKAEHYTFKAQVMRRFMDAKAYKAFVHQYDEHRRLPKEYQPTKRELRLVAKVAAGKLSLEGLQKRLGVKSIHNVYSKIGKIYVHTKR